ncbi:MAG: L-asparaginase, partial [Clostridia bacterium]|nr:L-asparaginase [Clostridia bacterium]
MKRFILLILSFVVLFTAVQALAEETAEEAAVPGQKPKVVILATGGTIAGVGDPGKVAGYKPGTLTAEVLL